MTIAQWYKRSIKDYVANHQVSVLSAVWEKEYASVSVLLLILWQFFGSSLAIYTMCECHEK